MDQAGQDNTETGSQNTDAPKSSDEQSQDQGVQGDPQGEQNGADQQGDDSKDGAEAAPEKYEDFNLPEGVTPDKDIIGELQVLAKELKLSQANAQRVVDLGVKMQQKQLSIFDQTSKKWEADAKADKEFGGEKLEANLAVAKKAMDEFTTPEFKQFLNTSKLGSHPEMIRTFIKIGKHFSEDSKHVSGTSKSGGKDQRSLYPNSNMNP